MIKENLVAERIAIDTTATDPLLRGQRPHHPRPDGGHPGEEEEHANDMHDLLVAHEGRPMLKK